MECVEYKFLMEITSQLGEDVGHMMSPTNKEQVGDIKVNGTLGSSHNEDEIEDPERSEQDT